MKKISRLIYMLAVLPLAVLSCVQEDKFVPGEPEEEGCYKIYFPTPQANAVEHTLDPSAPTTLTFTAMMPEPVDYDIYLQPEVKCTVNGEATEDAVFIASEITFKAGHTETTFTVDFPDAEIGVTYDCVVEVTDPQFALKYGTNPTCVSFSVTRVKWNRIYGENGEEYGTYQDDIFGGIGFGTMNSVFTNTQVEFYERDDKPGYYMIRNAYNGAMMSYLFEGSTANADAYAGFTRPTDIVFDATDPAKVFMPLQELGVNVNPDYGWINGGSFHHLNVNVDASQDLYGIFEDGIITFPAEGLVWIFPTTGEGSIANLNGLTKIIFPGYKDVDYSLQLAIGAADEEGVLPFRVDMGNDVKVVKYAAFEGELFEGDIEAKAYEITKGTVTPDGRITASGIYGLTLDETGLYTLVTVAYDEAGNQVAHDGGVFGYVAKGDEVPVNLNMGLIVSDRYAKEGLTAENSIEFYIYGEDIQNLSIGMFPSNIYNSDPEGCTAQVQYYGQVSEDVIKAVNGEGFSDIFIYLSPGTEYTMVASAYNGYTEQVFVETAVTAGVWRAEMATYTFTDLREAEKADYCKEWSFYAGTPDTYGRAEVGPVIVTDAGQEQDPEGNTYEYVDVKGIWSPIVELGWIKDDTQRWEYYEGFILNIDSVFGKITPDGEIIAEGSTFYGAEVSVLADGNGGIIGASIMGGVTEQGNVAFIDSGLFSSYGGFYALTFGLFTDDKYQSFAGYPIAYDELLFIDPANLEAGEEDSSDEIEAAMKLNQIKSIYVTEYNCVETDRQQLRNAIDKYNTRNARASLGVLAGIRTEIPHPQVKTSVAPYTGTFEAPETEVKYHIAR